MCYEVFLHLCVLLMAINSGSDVSHSRWAWRLVRRGGCLHEYKHTKQKKVPYFWLHVWLVPLFLVVRVCVFTSAVLELHLLFIRVLLGFNIPTVSERKGRASIKSCMHTSQHISQHYMEDLMPSSKCVSCDISRKVPCYMVHSQKLCVWTTRYFPLSLL